MAAAAYSALYALQHRGQESCGIAVNDDGVINGHRDLGLVNEVFTPAVLGSLAKPTAHMATGHVRYATSGSRIRANAQPMIVRHGRGTMALCHNGNLTNAIAVSYTHLDVYKRQVLACSSITTLLMSQCWAAASSSS